jgi:hypothetical protein
VLETGILIPHAHVDHGSRDVENEENVLDIAHGFSQGTNISVSALWISLGFLCSTL